MTWLVVGSIALLLIWRVEYLTHERNAEQNRAIAAELKIEDYRRLIELQFDTLDEHRHQHIQVMDIEQRTRTTFQDTQRQNVDLANKLKELHNNDSTLSNWLRSPTPPGLGRLYERPETIDPTAYRAAPLMPSDSMPITRPPSTDER